MVVCGLRTTVEVSPLIFIARRVDLPWRSFCPFFTRAGSSVAVGMRFQVGCTELGRPLSTRCPTDSMSWFGERDFRGHKATGLVCQTPRAHRANRATRLE